MSTQNTGNTDNNKEIITLLSHDHGKVNLLFEQFQLAKKANDINTKQFLVEMLCTELVIHSQVEQELLYPALQGAFNDPDLLEQAFVEHDIAYQLISDLELMEPEDEFYDAKFNVLCEYVQHHIKKEESQIFQKLKEFPLAETTILAFIKRREELRNEFGMPDEYEVLPDEYEVLSS